MSFKEKLINELRNLNSDYADWRKKTDLSKNDVIKFWNKNGEKVKKLVKNAEFNHDDFRVITEFIDYLFEYCFISRDDIQNNEFQEILKYQISLSLQFNLRVEKYLCKFDSKSSYYKKIKAISLIRFTKGSLDELKYIFGDVCILLSDVIENNPKETEECHNIIKEYMNLMFDSGAIYGNLWDNIISDYSPKEREKIISNEKLSGRLHGLYEKKSREYELNRNWLNDKIDQMIKYMKDNGYRNIPDRKIIDEKLSPLFKEYDELEKKQNELGDDTTNNFEDGDSWRIYKKGEDIFPHWDDEGYREARAKAGMKRLILGFEDDISEEEQDKIIDTLRKKYDGLNIVAERNTNVNVKKVEKSWNISSGLEHFTNVIMTELVKICSGEEESGSLKDEFDENKDKLLKMQKMVDSLLKDNADLKKKDEEKEKKLNDLYSKKAELESIIEKNPIINVNDILDKDIKARRKEYKITVIGGADKSIKWYNFNMKDQKFLNRLHNEFYLDETKFDLKGTFKQQKDKKFKSTIEDDLIFDRADIIIVLQSDHETEFKNRLDEIITDRSSPYRHRVTEFGEPEDDGKIRYNDQKFTPDRFYHYLEKALNKYEFHQMNSLIGL